MKDQKPFVFSPAASTMAKGASMLPNAIHSRPALSSVVV